MDRYGERRSNKQIYVTVVLTAAVVFALYHFFLRGPEEEYVQKAVAVLRGDSAVTGYVTFQQLAPNEPVIVSGMVQNLGPPSLRGFHIHELGDLSNGCDSTGGHFNPSDRDHGAPTDFEWMRHVGDLGNIQSDNDGTAKFKFPDKVISLNGPKSIIGRAVVVHEREDDLGLGGDEGSRKNGNAGKRVACGVVGLG